MKYFKVLYRSGKEVEYQIRPDTGSAETPRVTLDAVAEAMLNDNLIVMGRNGPGEAVIIRASEIAQVKFYEKEVMQE